MEAATSTTTVVTPGRQHYHPGMAKAWVQFNSSGTIQASYNVASVTPGATGFYTVTFTNAMSSTSYAAVATCWHATDINSTHVPAIISRGTSSFVVRSVQMNTTEAHVASNWSVVVYGDL
jgi:hypothetical protein